MLKNHGAKCAYIFLLSIQADSIVRCRKSILVFADSSGQSALFVLHLKVIYTKVISGTQRLFQIIKLYGALCSLTSRQVIFATCPVQSRYRWVTGKITIFYDESDACLLEMSQQGHFIQLCVKLVANDYKPHTDLERRQAGLNRGAHTLVVNFGIYRGQTGR